MGVRESMGSGELRAHVEGEVLDPGARGTLPRHAVPSTPYIVVGRSRDCDLVLEDPTISGRHARLTWEGARIKVEDLGSANGTFVRGERVMEAHVRPGDDLRLGRAPMPWSHAKIRPFLRQGGTDTIQAVSIPGRRFICGACGTRGVMPQGFAGGQLRCGACGASLQMGRARRKVSIPTMVSAVAACLLLVAGVWLWAGFDGSEPIREAAERLIPRSFEDGIAASPQEASIRVHTAEKVRDAIDATAELTRNTAARVAADDEGPFSVEQVARLWTHARSEWRYVNDPRGAEYFAKASESIGNGYVGDCDDFAIVLAAMIQSVGGQARVVMMDGPQGGHAYAEVCLPMSSEEVRDRLAKHYRAHRTARLGNQRVESIHYRPSEACAVWLNLDWNAGVPGGPYEQESWAVAIHPDGRTETLAPAGGVTPTGNPPITPASRVGAPP